MKEMFRLLFCLLMFGFCQPMMAQNTTTVKLDTGEDATLNRMASSSISGILSAVNLAYVNQSAIEISDEWVTPAGRKAINTLWQTSPFRCPENSINSQLVKRVDKFEVRNIPVFLKEISENGSDEQDVVFIVNQEGKVDNLYFGVELHQYQQIIGSQNDVRDLRRRQMILNFIEEFRTSYNRRDITYLEQVYSDDALIITGRVLQVESDGADIIGGGQTSTRVSYYRHTKKEYIESLRRVFSRNEYVNIGFDNVSVVQHRKFDYIYGVTLLQNWATTGYSDSGYLFLIINFINETEPVIHVRTWQPEKEVEPEDVFQLSEFWIQ